MKKLNPAPIIWIITIILIVLLGFFLLKPQITGRATVSRFSFTKAICNESNFCRDYEIECKNNEVIKMTPTSNVIKFSQDWKDNRSKEEIDILCQL